MRNMDHQGVEEGQDTAMPPVALGSSSVTTGARRVDQMEDRLDLSVKC